MSHPQRIRFSNATPDEIGRLDDLLEKTCRRRESGPDCLGERVGGLPERLVLFGVGTLGRKCLEVLLRSGVKPLALSDNNPGLWGREVNGIEVLPPHTAAARLGRNATFMVAIWSPGNSYKATRTQLASLGCSTVSPIAPLLWRYPDSLLPHFCADAPERLAGSAESIRGAFLLLSDDDSRREYLAQVALRLNADYDSLGSPSRNDQYFPADILELSDSEVLVDGGAFDGDTIAQFVSRRCGAFGHIYAFEPDEANFEALVGRVSHLPTDVQHRITVFRSALGAVPGRLRFSSNGSTSARVGEQGDTEVEVDALDQVTMAHEPTYVKFDIEGAELDALRGASNIIRRAKPKLAVCVYHRPDDLWRIPLYLHSLDSTYSFHLRSHEWDGLETVLYAVPESN